MDLRKSLRASITKFEDKKISLADLGRAVLHARDQIFDPEHLHSRQALERLGYRLISLAERSLHDDVQGEVRSLVDDVAAELIHLDS